MYDKLTQSDIDKIKAEIEHRKLVVRPEAIKAVQEARAQGDLSENFEYYAAKREKNSNESRIKYLENMLKTAQVIDHEYSSDEVGMNNTVVLFNERTQKEMTVRIVTTIRANPLKGLISIDSPIGKAVYRHKVGERLPVQLDNGEAYYVEIRSIGEAVDDSEDTISQY
ncbi:MAG: transcription elongation factor GreA [Lachnospiraceae bacterium]|nr:transcription elongation factor GreA [Lachnospiraceae bacterium]